MIRKAEYTDIRRALDIYDSARRFMRSRGNAVQWVNGYPSEELLRAANRKFESRFRYIERVLAREGVPLEQAGGARREALWREAKQKEKETGR